MTNIGMCFDREYPAPEVLHFARALEDGGVDQLWVIEDCFFTAGISLAAAALTSTERLTVGIGILPAVARNAAITAMELATLAQFGPGRLIAGIGHGVQDWMEQIGARTPSPLTTLEEVCTAVRRLLRGEEVSVEGREVQLRGVRLEAPPAIAPPMVAGVRGPKSMAVAGRACDGVILVEGAGPWAVRAARQQAGDPAGWRITTFTSMCTAPTREQAYEWMAPVVASFIRSANPSISQHPHFAEMQALLADGGEPALVGMPREWWLDIAAVGTFDDAVEHVQRLADAGVHDVAIFPPPELELGRQLIDDVIALRRAIPS
ncbi:MAG TPA: LLM class flavin-dependent oxidoreductase [Ilumatobacteraceae bacterium]|nr:LLM class flavin-dependent oxidoreductase [Ilumatobacteraceae bacterium]